MENYGDAIFEIPEIISEDFLMELAGKEKINLITTVLRDLQESQIYRLDSDREIVKVITRAEPANIALSCILVEFEENGEIKQGDFYNLLERVLEKGRKQIALNRDDGFWEYLLYMNPDVDEVKFCHNGRYLLGQSKMVKIEEH